MIKFEPYTKDQIFEILLARAQEALVDGAYDEEILEMIADVAGVDEKSMDEHRVMLGMPLTYCGELQNSLR